jgi:hypothetical protein
MPAIVRPAVLRDAAYVGPRMRDMDRLESLIALGLTGQAAVEHCIHLSSHALAIHDDRPKEPFCVLGVAPLLPDAASVWLLGTDEFDEHRRDLALLTEPILRQFLSVYPRLFIQVGEFNTKSIAYLKHFGFERMPLMDSPASPFIHLVRTTDV